MEAKFLHHHRRSLPSISIGRSMTHKPKNSLVVVSMVAKSKDNVAVATEKIASETKTVYHDNWFDRIATNYLSQTVQAITGIRAKQEGYEGLIEAVSVVSRNFNPNKQQELVIQSLHKAVPSPILSLIRNLLPNCKFTREYFATFTTYVFPWLVGSCEVKESEYQGKIEKNVVHIKKCRFLEETSCVGMCINLCKMPSQKFINDSFGIPVNMVPNFEDMSCDMKFGEHPPAAIDDPALKQPCYKLLCKAKQKHSVDCS